MRTIACLLPVGCALALLFALALASQPASAQQPQAPEPGRATLLPATAEADPVLARRTLSRVVVVGKQPQPRFTGARISLSLKDADLAEVLRSFARLAHVNLVLDPGVEGTVSVELHDAPWDQALWTILKTHRLAAELDGQLWAVSSQGSSQRFSQEGPPK